MQRAPIHEPVCAGVAPAAFAAAKTNATELVTPTRTAINAAVNAGKSGEGLLVASVIDVLSP